MPRLGPARRQEGGTGSVCQIVSGTPQLSQALQDLFEVALQERARFEGFTLVFLHFPGKVPEALPFAGGIEVDTRVDIGIGEHR